MDSSQLFLFEYTRRVRLRKIFLLTLAILLEYEKHKIRSRHYLTKEALPPVAHSGWRYLFQNGTDINFINVTSFDRTVFMYLLGYFRQEVFTRTRKRKGKRGRDLLLNPCDLLGLVLHYLNCTMKMKTLCQLFGCPPATLSRNLHLAVDSLEAILKIVPEASIK